MRRVAVFLFAILSASAIAQTAPPASPAAPSGPANWPTAQFASTKDTSVQKAYQVLNEMIRALGGDAYLNIRSIQTEGRSYGFYHGKPNGSSILYWRFWAWPDKERVELTKERDIIEIFDGNQGYETTYKGTTTLETKELEEFLRRRDHSLEWVVRKWLPEKGTTILYSGTAMVERNLADQVTVLNGSNDSVTISIDGTTHLPVRVSYSWRDPVDRQFDEESIVFGSYRPTQGVQTPYTVVRSRDGEMTNQRFVTTATYNTEMAPTLFEPKGLTYKKGNQPKQ